MNLQYKSDLGSFYLGNSKCLDRHSLGESIIGKVQLILTSPPFPLNSKKRYGNLEGDKYIEWFVSFAPLFSKLLKDNGSIVIEMGNSWEHGRPVQSLLHLEALMGFVKNKDANLRLCQQFISYNPSKLPSPAQWVTVNNIRAVDSFTHIWWIAKDDFPKANTNNVLRPYSKSMKDLLKRQSYNSGRRPSEHIVGENSFLKNRGGSLPHNFFEIDAMDADRPPRLPNAFSFSNTNSNDFFHRKCRERGITLHPARMPEGLASFFIELLTDPNDLVLDPFAGSNTTGFVAECLGRKWLAIECQEDYIEQALIRFEDPLVKKFSRSRDGIY
jgi:hypothetical protein